jgi:hypothetical protein
MQPPAEPDHGPPELEPGPPPQLEPAGSPGLEAAGSPGLESIGSPGLEPAGPPIRASDRERDAALQRLQGAFAEGRIDDQEFDERMRAALVARTRAELDQILADLPRSAELAPPPVQSAGRLLLTLKGEVQRRGRWRVPERFNAVAYKGGCEVDLRAAELSGASTTITAVAYKGRVEILVPPGVRVQVHGYSYGGHWADQVPDHDLPAGAPVVHVRAIVYKGVVEARPTPMPDREITRG